MKLSKKLVDMGCTIAIKEAPKNGSVYFLAFVKHQSKTIRITQRFGVFSRYFVDSKGFDNLGKVQNYILETINQEQVNK